MKNSICLILLTLLLNTHNVFTQTFPEIGDLEARKLIPDFVITPVHPLVAQTDFNTSKNVITNLADSIDLYAMSITPNNKYFTIGRGNSLGVFDIKTGEVIKYININARVSSAVFSTDGMLVAISGENGAPINNIVNIFNFKSGESISSISKHFQTSIRPIGFSADNETVICLVSRFTQNQFCSYSVETGELLWTYDIPGENLPEYGFDPYRSKIYLIDEASSKNKETTTIKVLNIDLRQEEKQLLVDYKIIGRSLHSLEYTGDLIYYDFLKNKLLLISVRTGKTFLLQSIDDSVMRSFTQTSHQDEKLFFSYYNRINMVYGDLYEKIKVIDLSGIDNSFDTDRSYQYRAMITPDLKSAIVVRKNGYIFYNIETETIINKFVQPSPKDYYWDSTPFKINVEKPFLQNFTMNNGGELFTNIIKSRNHFTPNTYYATIKTKNGKVYHLDEELLGTVYFYLEDKNLIIARNLKQANYVVYSLDEKIAIAYLEEGYIYLSPNNKKLVLRPLSLGHGSGTGNFRVYDTNTWEVENTININCYAFHNVLVSNESLIIGSSDGGIRLVDLKSGNLYLTLYLLENDNFIGWDSNNVPFGIKNVSEYVNYQETISIDRTDIGQFYGKLARINTDILRLRSLPSLEGEIIGRMVQDTRVKIIRRSINKFKVGDMYDYWYLIKTENNLNGWCYGAFIEIL